jgi:hypothetical protein
MSFFVYSWMLKIKHPWCGVFSGVQRRKPGDLVALQQRFPAPLFAKRALVLNYHLRKVCSDRIYNAEKQTKRFGFYRI